MKKIIIGIIFSVLISGCDTLPPVNDSKPSQENDIQKDISNSDDQYYLKIAKDLYVEKQYQQAIKIAQNLAEKGNLEAQYLLGYLLYYGQGVKENKELGSKWIKTSADSGYRPAIEALVMIKYGLTPNNKCEPSVKISDDIEKVKHEQTMNNETSSQPAKTEREKQSQVQQSNTKDESSIALQASTEITSESFNTGSDRQWKRFTIQLMQTSNIEYLKDFYHAFKQQYPEWGDYLITYHSDKQPYDYGVGFNTYKSIS